MSISAADFVAALPKGEWDDVQVISQGDGMMAGRNWAILATATSLRYGGRAAFLKCIVLAPDNAGFETNLVTAKHRVERVRARLEACRAANPPVPLVSVLECRFLPSFDGLLIAMERVTTLDALLRNQSADSVLAVKVLRTLDPGSTPRWHHYDVCPKNVAVTAAGDVVFIDVESFYLPDGDAFDVSVPATKQFRMPFGVNQTVQEELAKNQNRLGTAAANRKQAFDLVLLAAECSLGGLPDFMPRLSLSEEWLDRIVAEASPEKRELAAFWVQQMRPALTTATTLNVPRIATELEELMAGKRKPAPAAPTEPVRPQAQLPQVAAPKDPEAMTDFEREWELLRSRARDLRRDVLDAPSIAEYRKKLERLAERHPDNPLVWDELLLVVISYQRNPADALRFTDQATRARPDDSNLRRWHQIVTMWATA